MKFLSVFALLSAVWIALASPMTTPDGNSTNATNSPAAVECDCQGKVTSVIAMTQSLFSDIPNRHSDPGRTNYICGRPGLVGRGRVRDHFCASESLTNGSPAAAITLTRSGTTRFVAELRQIVRSEAYGDDSSRASISPCAVLGPTKSTRSSQPVRPMMAPHLPDQTGSYTRRHSRAPRCFAASVH